MVAMIKKINQPYNTHRKAIVRNVDNLPDPLSVFADYRDSFAIQGGACEYGYTGLDGHIYVGHCACHSDLGNVDPKNFGYAYNFIYSRDNLSVHPRFIEWLFSDASPWRNCFKTLVRGEVNGLQMYAISDIELLSVEVMSFFKAPRIYTECGVAHINFFNKMLDDPLIHPGIAFVFAQLYPPNSEGIHRSSANWHGATFDQSFTVDTLDNFMNGTPNLNGRHDYNYYVFADNRDYAGVNAMWNLKYKGKLITYESYLTKTYTDIIEPEQIVTTRFGEKVSKGGILQTNTLIALARKESERWL